MEAIKTIYSNTVHEEYPEQQNKIEIAFILDKKIRVGVDTSYSQVRNAEFLQNAFL